MKSQFPTFRRLASIELPAPVLWRGRATAAPRQSLLRLIAVAAEENLPLAPLLEAWSENEWPAQKRRLRRLARLLVHGTALPDALDVLVICLEGGLSLPGALKRVSSELRTAHPTLANELNLVQREIQLGRSPGEALQQMGIRTDLEEIRSLASVVSQAERFGASLVKSLRVHAETLRLKRQQYAEEMAQKAIIKVLFPTLLFIFPGIFIVILGPAAIQIYEMLALIKK